MTDKPLPSQGLPAGVSDLNVVTEQHYTSRPDEMRRVAGSNGITQQAPNPDDIVHEDSWADRDAKRRSGRDKALNRF